MSNFDRRIHFIIKMIESTIECTKKSFKRLEEKFRNRAPIWAYEIGDDQWRRFWIYFIVSLFFIIMGLTLYTGDASEDVSVSITVVTLWIIAGLLLFISVFRLSERTGFYSNDEERLITKPKVLWFIVNLMYVIYLALSTVWLTELNSNSSSWIRTIFGVIIILVGLVLARVLLDDRDMKITFDLVIIFLFCITWVIMSIVSVINFS